MRWIARGATPVALIILAMGLLMLTQTAEAQDVAAEATAAVAGAADAAEAAVEEVAYLPQGTADILWLLIGGILVMFMQAGFAMVETGLTRAKNATNIMSKNLMDFCLGALLYWAIGYSLMYGDDHSGILGIQ